MSDNSMNGTGNNGRVVDSLVANEFVLEIDGQAVTGIFRVSGLTTFKLDEALKRTYGPIQIAKMVQRDANSPFNKWLRQTISAAVAADRPTRTVTVVAVDDGVEIRRWSLIDAKINEISYSPFDTASGDMVEERITLTYARIEESWPATPNLE